MRTYRTYDVFGKEACVRIAHMTFSGRRQAYVQKFCWRKWDAIGFVAAKFLKAFKIKSSPYLEQSVMAKRVGFCPFSPVTTPKVKGRCLVLYISPSVKTTDHS